MKHVLVSLLLIAAAAPLPARAQPSLSTEAQRAYMAGDYTTAKTKFQMILASDPRNAVARNYLRMIAVAEAQAGPGAKLESRLKKLILPKVDLKEATLDASLDFLRQTAETVSGGKIKTSFVLQTGVNPSARVTLHLSNIPFTEVLRYVGDLANVQFTVEKYAISVRPKSAAAEAEAAASATP